MSAVAVDVLVGLLAGLEYPDMSGSTFAQRLGAFAHTLAQNVEVERDELLAALAGIQTGGSERAFDLYMKARYLHQRHPGHGLTAATGTGQWAMPPPSVEPRGARAPTRGRRTAAWDRFQKSPSA